MLWLNIGALIARTVLIRCRASLLLQRQRQTGDRTIHRLFSDGSGETDSALRELHITLETSQPGVAPNNALAERMAQDVLQGARTIIVRVGLPPCLFGICLQTLLSDGKDVLPTRKSVVADVVDSSGMSTCLQLEVNGSTQYALYLKRLNTL